MRLHASLVTAARAGGRFRHTLYRLLKGGALACEAATGGPPLCATEILTLRKAAV